MVKLIWQFNENYNSFIYINIILIIVKVRVSKLEIWELRIQAASNLLTNWNFPHILINLQTNFNKNK